MGFRDQYSFLSNFWPVDIVHEGFTYPSVEHAYQASKTLDGKARAGIRAASSPGEAQRLGRMAPLIPGWDALKVGVMHGLLMHKFHDKDLGPMLLSTLGRHLYEANAWGDDFWGVVQGPDGLWRGQNHLGNLLMQVRKKILDEYVARL